MYDNVQTDRQWIRRVLRQEKHLIDSMHHKQDLLDAYQKKRKGITPAVAFGSPSVTSHIRHEQSKSLRQADHLDDISMASVATPKTSYTASSIKSGYSMTNDYDTIYTSMTSKMKAQKLMRQLQQQRNNRKQMQKKLERAKKFASGMSSR